MLLRDLTKGNEFSNACIGKNNIDSSLHLADCLVETIKIGQFGDVSLNARHVAADCVYGLLEFLLTPSRDEDIGALIDEEPCCSQPYALSAAGDNCDFFL